MSSRLRPSSTRGSPEELSTMIKVAASRGRSARGLARVLGACGCSTVMLPPLDQALARPLVRCLSTASSLGSRQRQSAFRCRAAVASFAAWRKCRGGGCRPPSTLIVAMPASSLPRAPEASAEAATPRQARCDRAIALALRQHLKAQRARGGNRLDEAHAHRITQPIGFATAVTDQCVLVFVIAPVIVADGGGRHEAVGPCLGEANKQARARDARNAGFELCPDTVGEVARNQPIVGLALGSHSTALGLRDCQ